MGRNFDDYPGFQKFLAMRNITLYSVHNVKSYISQKKFDVVVFLSDVLTKQTDKLRSD
jgi:hypothetical protein